MDSPTRRGPPPLRSQQAVTEYVRSFDPRLADQPITHEMPVLPPPGQVAFYPVERPNCGAEHGRVCAMQGEHERRITALENDSKEAQRDRERQRRAGFYALAASGVGGALVALFAWALGRMG